MKNGTIRWLYEMPGKKRRNILLLAVLQSANSILGVAYAFLLRGIIDGAVSRDLKQFQLYAVLMVLTAAVQLGIRAWLRRLIELTRATLENIMKKRLAGRLLQKDFEEVSAVHSGEWMNLLTNDTVVVANGCTDLLPNFAGMVIRLLSALVMLAFLHLKMALLLAAGGIFLLLMAYAFRRLLKQLHKEVQEADGRLRSFLQERLSSLIIIRTFASESRTMEAVEEKTEEHLAARMKRNRLANICNLGYGTAVQGMRILCVCYCAYGVFTGKISYGMMAAVGQLFDQIQAPIANLSGFLPGFTAVLASSERLMEIESYREEDEKELLPAEEITRFYSEELHSLGMNGVSFVYRRGNGAEKSEQVLRDLSVEIQKGEILAIRGDSGRGKTTFLKVLMGLYHPSEGSCYIRDRQGRVIPLTPKWRRLFAYVPQGNFLMSGSIREVVSFAAPECAQDEARLRQALRIACAEDFVLQTENGLDTELGERGVGLSEGQMQRLAIARAVFSGSPVLILDESTSALDAKTESSLLTNLKNMTDKTILIVSHRAAVEKICSRVISIRHEKGEHRK